MINAYGIPLQRTESDSTNYARRQSMIKAWLWPLLWVGFCGLMALVMVVLGPSLLIVGGLSALLLLGLLVYEPRYGLYLILFCTLVADRYLLPTYPFTINLSSPESLLYINNALIVSPLEIFLVFSLLVWLAKGLFQRKVTFFGGPLLPWTLFFVGTISFGLIYGVLMGGNANTALWEVRPIFYVPLMVIAVSNLLKKKAHVNQLMGVIVAAIVVEGILGSYYYLVTLNMNLDNVKWITEHAAAIQMNTVFILLIGLWIYRGSLRYRLILPLLSMPIVLTYLATQRRAAFVALGVAIVLLILLLYKENRQQFWTIAPIVLIIGTMYLGLFWNSRGALGLPAQAVKSIVAPTNNSEDARSNYYRELENQNLSYTIHRSPVTGVGFGRKFHIIVQMPDISHFIWWEYITHNSILWIWAKAGVLGFVALLLFVGTAINRGVRTLTSLSDGNLRAIALTATLYLVMHFLYAYVDMSWDIQSMIYVGTAIGFINVLPKIERDQQQIVEMRAIDSQGESAHETK